MVGIECSTYLSIMFMIKDVILSTNGNGSAVWSLGDNKWFL